MKKRGFGANKYNGKYKPDIAGYSLIIVASRFRWQSRTRRERVPSCFARIGGESMANGRCEDDWTYPDVGRSHDSGEVTDKNWHQRIRF